MNIKLRVWETASPIHTSRLLVPFLTGEHLYLVFKEIRKKYSGVITNYYQKL